MPRRDRHVLRRHNDAGASGGAENPLTFAHSHGFSTKKGWTGVSLWYRVRFAESGVSPSRLRSHRHPAHSFPIQQKKGTARILSKLPSMQFYPHDWLSDPSLRSVSLAARGLWIDLLCLMWDAPERGVLERKIELNLSKVVGHRTDFVRKLLTELEKAKVFSRQVGSRRIYSRRMVSEELVRKQHRDSYHRTRTPFGRDSDAIRNDFGSHSSSSSSSSSSNLKKETDRSAAAVNGEMQKAAAAAFIDIGFDKPFGRPNFQAVWVTHFLTAREKNSYVTEAMEGTIQECQKQNIGIPPQFYAAKHDVEAAETNAQKPLKRYGEE